MSTARIYTMASFPEAFRAYIAQLIPTLGEELTKAIARHLWLELGITSPIGHPLRDPHPGKYQASHTISLGGPAYKKLRDLPSYPRLSGPEADSVLTAAQPGQAIYISNAAANDRKPDQSYAGLLEGGRRQYSRLKSRKTMWIGSTQAPEGVYYPALKAISTQRDTIAAEAIAATEARM